MQNKRFSKPTDKNSVILEGNVTKLARINQAEEASAVRIYLPIWHTVLLIVLPAS
jgi:hypothetical protein